MKSPRELILSRHEAATPDLDALRARVLSELAPADATPQPPNPSRGSRARDWFHWMRPWPRQLAAMGCLWLFVSFLNRQSAPTLPVTPTDRAPGIAHRIVSSLRENRRQISELIAPPQPPAAVPHARMPVRRRTPVEISVLA
ncbi:MAG: hypothetical protein JNL10_07970 [Verrucomicrobiales bacterium]|nr:hypothetical protein [Verrucomicrobiales bacterium]